jgi:BirA family biotin operon repressor/biotin-[acetyl-CoA-carboxylase] ligase
MRKGLKIRDNPVQVNDPLIQYSDRILRDQASPSAFNLSALKRGLGSYASRFDATAVAECDSSNAQLLTRAEAGAPAGTVLVADRQTAGRGRRGRAWHSALNDSLTFSLLWRFPADSQAPTALSLVVGLAVADALEGLGATGIGLKWPNDLLHDNRKLAGILIELVSGELRAAVIGIGLNLHLPVGLPDDLRDSVTSLDCLLTSVPSRETVLAALLMQLADTFDIYSRHGFAALRERWQARHVYNGRAVRLLADHGPEISGVCVGVAADGALLLDIDGCVERFISGDLIGNLSLRPA